MTGEDVLATGRLGVVWCSDKGAQSTRPCPRPAAVAAEKPQQPPQGPGPQMRSLAQFERVSASCAELHACGPPPAYPRQQGGRTSVLITAPEAASSPRAYRAVPSRRSASAPAPAETVLFAELGRSGGRCWLVRATPARPHARSGRHADHAEAAPPSPAPLPRACVCRWMRKTAQPSTHHPHTLLPSSHLLRALLPFLHPPSPMRRRD